MIMVLIVAAGAVPGVIVAEVLVGVEEASGVAVAGARNLGAIPRKAARVCDAVDSTVRRELGRLVSLRSAALHLTI